MNLHGRQAGKKKNSKKYSGKCDYCAQIIIPTICFVFKCLTRNLEPAPTYVMLQTVSVILDFLRATLTKQKETGPCMMP